MQRSAEDKRLLEDLRHAMETAHAAYVSALRATGPHAEQLRRDAYRAYKDALQHFTDFVIHGKKPSRRAAS